MNNSQSLFMNILVMTLLAVTSVADLDTDTARLTKEELAKLSSKVLRRMLAERGEACRGCSEKQEFVEKVFEVQDLPLKSKPEEPTENNAKDKKDFKEDDIMEMLKKSGFNGKMYSRKDFENLATDPDSPLKRKKKKPQVEDDSEKIEL
mmetsp:Transcript_3723/g.3860  ORF Transcript_3723/g.3860 Transcript_3723/m.3860 type:complete len:149 (+) Transcript_3723:91-537(+)|eukprot:CAMPEP_0182428046 /NCGR_PEP_ID=MMETSP1167-20130531/20981_1 /TAXON_ID=2988 /ORGANISM="Mallomonas Sp, Strain CCMP3275" /LENGTH=148 /DNA_ID=CAMNT_0024610689 /DNA_START=1 /DNA_END=447 /DNA_ORIENTATION=-